MRRLRRVLRWAWNGLALLSLLLCAAALVLWPLSYRYRGMLPYTRAPASFGCCSSVEGRLMANYTRQPVDPARQGWACVWYVEPPARYGRYEQYDTDPRVAWRGMGFVALRQDAPAPRSGGVRFVYRAIVIPLWAVALVAAFPPAMALRRRRRSRARRRAGLCPACSYDLTGNVSGVCPECGNGVMKGTA